MEPKSPISNPGTPRDDWQIESGGLVLGERLRTSFQRYARPPQGCLEKPPTSLGLLPVAIDATGALLLPMAKDEAVWIGLTAISRSSPVAIGLAVETHAREALDAISGRPWSEDNFTPIVVCDHHAIDGISRDGRSLWAFQRAPAPGAAPACKAFIFNQFTVDRPRQADLVTRIHLASYEEFQTLTSCPPPSPLDPASGYRGWRLP